MILKLFLFVYFVSYSARKSIYFWPLIIFNMKNPSRTPSEQQTPSFIYCFDLTNNALLMCVFFSFCAFPCRYDIHFPSFNALLTTKIRSFFFWKREFNSFRIIMVPTFLTKRLRCSAPKTSNHSLYLIILH